MNAEKSPEEQEGKKVVVHIDDDLMIRRGISRSLNGRRNPQIEYHSYGSGSDFLEELRTGKLGDPNLIISDWDMPEMNGPQIRSKLEAEMPHLLSRFRMLTGAVITGEREKYVEEKGVIIWSKTCENLREEVYEALGLEMPDD